MDFTNSLDCFTDTNSLMPRTTSFPMYKIHKLLDMSMISSDDDVYENQSVSAVSCQDIPAIATFFPIDVQVLLLYSFR